MKQTILVIDEPRTGMILEFACSDTYSIRVFDNGYEALGWMRKGNCPHLLIVNMDMLSNGQECIDSIRKMEGMNDIPILMLSSKPARTFSFNTAGCLQQPVDAGGLVSSIQQLLQHVRLAA